jgi:hypothetical protein
MKTGNAAKEANIWITKKLRAQIKASWMEQWKKEYTSTRFPNTSEIRLRRK